MSIVYLPTSRNSSTAEYGPLRARPTMSRFGAALQLVQRHTPAHAYCAVCAAPIDFGVVWRSGEAFCSVDCSLGGNRPA